MSPTSMSQSAQFRNALWAILDAIDPDEAKREISSDTLRLFEAIRSYELSPRLYQFLKLVGDEIDDPRFSVPADAMPLLNSCLMEFGLPTVENIPPPRPEPPCVLDSRPIATEPPTQIPLPAEWPEFVLGIRERLCSECGPQSPFSQWTLPQYRWSSRWIDSYSVIAADEQVFKSAFLLVPSELSATSPEAERCWCKRIEAAQRLQRMPTFSQIARVLLQNEAEIPCGIALVRTEFTRRTLADRFQASERLSIRECIELGISLCGILGTLNAQGIHVLDLSQSWIAFDWSAGQRFTQLLDPTAVIPGHGLLPEWRGVELGMADAAELANPETSQVLLIGALVLASMCDTTADLITARFPNGRSTTFASLSGSQHLANSHPDTIAAPLVADLARKATLMSEAVDTQAIAETIQWSVAERQDERFDSLLRFGSELRKAIR